MKTLGSNEYYNAKFDNHFDEFKSFKAEQYYSTEAAKSPVELVKVEESFNEVEITKNKQKISEFDNSDELRKELNKLNANSQQAPSETSSTSASTSSGSASSSSSASASSSAHAVAETATTAAGTVASVTVTAAVVAVTGVVGIIDEPYNEPEPDPQIALNVFYDNAMEDTFDAGSDYVILTLDKSDMVMEGDSLNDLFKIEIFLKDENGERKNIDSIEIQNGQDEYLVTGLEPSTVYSYDITYSKYSEVSNLFRAFSAPVTRYTSTFESGDSTGPAKLILDKENTKVTLHEDNHLADVDYSLYLSNYNNSEVDPLLTVTKSEIEDAYDVSRLYTDETIKNNHYFSGSLETTREKLFFNAFGATESSEWDILGSIEYLTKIPANYADYHLIDFEYDISNTNYLDAVYGSTVIRDYKDDLNLDDIYCLAEQFDENGDTIEVSEASVEFGETDLACSLSLRPAYGVKSIIWRLYLGEDETLIYESKPCEYNVDQSYGATFTAVDAKDAMVKSYNDDGTVTFEINTQFSCEGPDVFSYKVEAIDDNNNVVGTYEGSDYVATLSVPENTNFTLRYTKIGLFGDGEHIYGTEYSNGKTIAKEPKLTLSSEPVFNGQNWTIPYTCDSIYGYDSLSATLTLTTSWNTYTINLSTVEATGEIVIDAFDEEPGDCSLEGTLMFDDNQTVSSDDFESIIENQNYTMEWAFSIDKTIVNMTKSYLPVEFNMSYLCPDDYTLLFTDNVGGVETSPLTDSFTFYNTVSNDYTMTVELLNTDGNIVRMQDVEIKPDDATAAFNGNTFSFNAVNPGESVVTYNSDNTRNVYRKMNVSLDSTSPDNFFYDAELVRDASFNATLNEYVEEGIIHCIDNGEYSAIEYFPMDYYSLRYYKVYESNGVYYQFDETYPSGGFDGIEGSWSVSGSYDSATDTSTIELNNNHYMTPINWYELNGVEYQFTDWDEDMVQGVYTIEASGNVSGQTIKVQAGENVNTYNSYAQDIAMKGEIYATIAVEIPTL